MATVTRLERRIDPEQKRLIDGAVAAEHTSMSTFVVDTLVRPTRAVVGGWESQAPRPIGAWTFSLPEGWDEPLDDFADRL